MCIRDSVYADIRMAPLETGGTALSVTMDVPKTLYAADIGVCMFSAVHLALSLALDGWPYVLLHGLRYVCVPGPVSYTHLDVYKRQDMHRGQSLVVWAIQEGRAAAREVDESLMGYTNLE